MLNMRSTSTTTENSAESALNTQAHMNCTSSDNVCHPISSHSFSHTTHQHKNFTGETLTWGAQTDPNIPHLV